MTSTPKSTLIDSPTPKLSTPSPRPPDPTPDLYSPNDQTSIRVGEDGEAIGTVHHVADALRASYASVLQCARESRSVILIQREDGDDPVLILPDGVEDFARCARTQ